MAGMAFLHPCSPSNFGHVAAFMADDESEMITDPEPVNGKVGQLDATDRPRRTRGAGLISVVGGFKHLLFSLVIINKWLVDVTHIFHRGGSTTKQISSDENQPLKAK